jgi:site-specific recombinase XerD
MWLVDYEDETGARKRVSTGIKTAPQKQPPNEVKSAGREIVLGIRTPQAMPVSSAGKAHKRDGRMTVSELLDKCEGTVWHPDNVRSQRTIKSNVGILRSMVGDEAVEDMTFTRLETLVQAMKTRGYQPATIKRKLAMLAKALKMATMWTDEKGQPLLRYKPPLPKIVVNNLKDRIISPVEQEALFAAVEKRRQLEPNRQWFRFRVFLQVVFATGGRLSEVLHIGPKNITRIGETSYVTFPRYRTKSGKPRTLPLTDDAVAAVGSLMDHLVLDREAQEWRFFGLTPSTMDVMFKQAREDVERETGMDLTGVSIHTIRHTVLTRLARGGMGLAQLQMWAGHSDPKITAERYLHLMPNDLVAGLSILGTHGTPDANQARDRISPVNVPSTTGDANSASRGTASLQ